MDRLVVRRTFVEVIRDEEEVAVLRRKSAPPGSCRNNHPFEEDDSDCASQVVPKRGFFDRAGSDALSMSCAFLKGNYWWSTTDDDEAVAREDELDQLEAQRAALQASGKDVKAHAEEACAAEATELDMTCPPTTVIMRNLPHDYTRDQLIRLVETEGYLGKYDFIYLPIEFGSHYAFGYAFVNLIGPMEAIQFREHFEGFSFGGGPSEKTAEVGWSLTQGLAQHVDRYRNSPMMHEDVPEEYKPVMLHDGVRIDFPPPTKRVSYPRGRRCRGSRLRMLNEVQQKLEFEKDDNADPEATAPLRAATMESPLLGGLEFEWLGTGRKAVPPPPPEHGAGAVARAGLGLTAATPNPPQWQPWFDSFNGNMIQGKDLNQSLSGGGTSSDGDSSTQTPSSCARSLAGYSFRSGSSLSKRGRSRGRNHTPRNSTGPFSVRATNSWAGSILAGGLEASHETQVCLQQQPSQQPPAPAVPLPLTLTGSAQGRVTKQASEHDTPVGNLGLPMGASRAVALEAASKGKLLDPHSVVEIIGAYPSGVQGKILTVNYAEATYKVQLLPRGRIKVVKAENVRLISARPPQ